MRADLRVPQVQRMTQALGATVVLHSVGERGSLRRAASEAGIQKDDVITAIDGMPAASLTLTRIGEMLEQPLARQVAIRRGDQPITVKMTPRSLV